MNGGTVNAIIDVQRERLELGQKKSNDYSARVDNIKLAGMYGLATRIFDKACRLLSLTHPGHTQKVMDESIEDTLKDLGNYADYGVVLKRGQWEVKE